jgi:transcriptional regulator with PAS, ATPase and Fis domain
VFKKQVLLTWLGRHDLDGRSEAKPGPIASVALNSDWPFDEIRILVSGWFDEAGAYENWLKAVLSKQNRHPIISVRKCELSSPIDYPGIYMVCRAELSELADENAKTTLNLTSGTPAMAANWLLLGKGVFDTKLVQTSVQGGLSVVELPFDISLEYLERQDSQLGNISGSKPDVDTHFEHLESKTPLMQDVVSLAKKLAARNVPVIIQGETGTGKEVIAEAIHSASLRAAKSLIAVNCAAIPESLIDSHLFGHRKGAFTGADANRNGCFDEAEGGTLFLDEVGELSLEAQAKLLRALQKNEITTVGDSKPHRVDVRVIAATHRDLLSMVEQGDFREDLFYRLAIGVIQLPPLRKRVEDIPSLVKVLLGQLNEEAQSQPGYVSKNISDSAIKFVEAQSWPGNIRELWNTLLRASIWSDGSELTAEHLQKAMIERSGKKPKNTYLPDLGQGIDINEVLDKTKRYYAEEALKATAGQKGKAAKLLGLANHQTLGNWLKQWGMD